MSSLVHPGCLACQLTVRRYAYKRLIWKETMRWGGLPGRFSAAPAWNLHAGLGSFAILE